MNYKIISLMVSIFLCVFSLILLLTACGDKNVQPDSVNPARKEIQLIIPQIYMPIENSEMIRIVEDIVVNGVEMTQKEVSELKIPAGGLSLEMRLLEVDSMPQGDYPDYDEYFFGAQFFVKKAHNEEEKNQSFNYANKDDFDKIMNIYWENEDNHRKEWEKQKK